MTFFSINPATGERFAEHPIADNAALDRAMADARVGFGVWSSMPVAARAAVLTRFADLLRADAQDLAKLVAMEMGKPLQHARAEALKCAGLCDYYAEHTEGLLTPRTTDTDDARVLVSHDPLGVIFSITPWNFPLWQILRAAIPVLAAGNAVINKPAPNVIGCARRIVDLFTQAGAPSGVLQTVTATNEGSSRLIADPRIVGVTLTGSERAGSAVAAQAGTHLKKVVLELGGSDPFIVLADADLEAAAQVGVRSRFTNAGQVCIAAKRFIVEASVREAFAEAFLAAADALRMGDPLQEDTDLGPMARSDLRSELADQVNDSIAGGAQVLRRGGVRQGPGFFFEPAVLADAPATSRVLTEETFGPAAVLMSVAGPDEAVALANDTPYGLSANLWTRDEDLGLALARRIESGNVFINSMTASDPRFPFGGIKRSGFGRELGPEGLMEFVNTRTIVIKRS